MSEAIPVGAQEGVSDHFAAGMQFRVTPTGDIEFLVIGYRQDGHKFETIKFPGGTNKLSKEPPRFRDESPTVTLQREWKDEVGTELEEAYRNPYSIPLKDPKTGQTHTKFFFLIGESMTTGRLRTTEKVEREQGSKTEYLSPPKWVSVTILQGRDGIRNQFHRDALTAALEAVEAMRRRGELPRNTRAFPPVTATVSSSGQMPASANLFP